jgi:DivIVA domain-containing protein
MALTPEDVVNKQFQQTKFREGYDQDEVDDFLDEVVVELRRLIQENQDLQERLSQAESGAPAPTASVEAAPVPEPVAAAPVAAPEPVAPAPVQDESESSNSLLVLARRLHDEHVREGAEKRDQLIAEGNATAARVVAEAEAKQREELAKLDERRSVLEREIDQLREFEREYRQKLRSYIEGQLHDLDSGAAASTGGIAAGVGDNH